ncbi:hypothetical protein BCV70DRAFT_70640 [Testicularia cyperi]|uniref:Uncharacterized protein n=1 Tax=Testicularia cyperi TaxID=1882483 RepID=A0A317XI73_9BASI|nr:hypothetical protein BCV70DRAFT_70640 [Testicularia cyperi]
MSRNRTRLQPQYCPVLHLAIAWSLHMTEPGFSERLCRSLQCTLFPCLGCSFYASLSLASPLTSRQELQLLCRYSTVPCCNEQPQSQNLHALELPRVCCWTTMAHAGLNHPARPARLAQAGEPMTLRLQRSSESSQGQEDLRE